MVMQVQRMAGCTLDLQTHIHVMCLLLQSLFCVFPRGILGSSTSGYVVFAMFILKDIMLDSMHFQGREAEPLHGIMTHKCYKKKTTAACVLTQHSFVQTMLGSFDSSMPGAVHSTSDMTSVLAGYNQRQYPLVQNAMAFNTQYRCAAHLPCLSA
jgi:hypothetical protein